MSATIRLLGPDIPQPPGELSLTVSAGDSVLALKQTAIANWPSGNEPPQLAQIKIIFQGKYLPDEKALRTVHQSVADGETTAMHLIVKQLITETKAASGAPGKSGDAGTRCACVIS